MPVINTTTDGSGVIGASGSSGTEDVEAEQLRLRQQYREKLQRLRAESLRRSSDSGRFQEGENLGRGSNVSLVGLGEDWKTVGVVEDDDEEEDSQYVLKAYQNSGSQEHMSNQERERINSSQSHGRSDDAFRVLTDGVSASDSCLGERSVSLEAFRFKRQSPRINYRYLEATRYQYLNGYLKPNAKFVGEQRSGRERYRITVEFQLVDWQNLVVTGFLHITGLTEDHPEITTCFTGEIINNPFFDAEALEASEYEFGSSSSSTYFSSMNKSYSFLTENKSWGSFPQNDLEHWRRLTNCLLQVSDSLFKKELAEIIKGKLKQGMVYMRWKEEFLLPDSRVKSIRGASFEGFYYIALNIGSGESSQTSKLHSGYSTSGVIKQFVDQPGTITGLYYHRTSEKFQSLFLKYVEDYGRSSTFDFA